jgi:hypothetical protein
VDVQDEDLEGDPLPKNLEDPLHPLNQTLFVFRNAGTEPSAICDVYFDDGTLLGIADVINGPDVRFSQYAKPGNLSGGGSLTPPFETTAGFSADSDSPKTFLNGVGPNEWLGILFTLQSGKDFQSVNDALVLGVHSPATPGSLRIGIHVQGIGPNDDSEGLVHAPLPGAVLLGMLGMGVAGWRLRRFA